MSETSRRCPRPVRSRACSAARIPLAAESPQTMSISAAPTFSGRPSGSPVTLISPLTAWSKQVVTRQPAPGGSDPNALTEQ